MWVLTLYESNLVLNGLCLFAHACILYEQLHPVIVINIAEQPVVVLMVNSYHLQKQQGSGVLWKRSKQSPVNAAENQA